MRLQPSRSPLDCMLNPVVNMKGGPVADGRDGFDLNTFFSGKPLSRRQFLARGALVLSVPALAGSVLAACGSSSPSSTASISPSSAANPVGQAVISNFPDWIGPNEVKDFHKLFPQASVYMNTSMPSTIAGTVELIKNISGAYDAALGDLPTSARSKAAGVYQSPTGRRCRTSLTSTRPIGAIIRMRCPTTTDSALSATERTSSPSP